MNRGINDEVMRVNVLRRIVQLRQSLDAKKRELDRARSSLEAAKQTEAQQRNALKTIDEEARVLGKETHRATSAVYLDGDTQNRGMLSLGDEAIHFSGWRGHFEVPIGDVKDVQVGTAPIPPRAGIPLLDRYWSGEPRQTSTLLLVVQHDADSAPCTMTLADVADALAWPEYIRDQQDQLGHVAASRADSIERRQQAEGALAEAGYTRQKARANLEFLRKEVASLRDELNRAERERSKSKRPEIDAALLDLIRIEHEALRRLKDSQRD